MAEQTDVLIIGAGIAGLAAAHTLQENSFQVIVIEAQDYAGGRIRTDRIGGFVFDAGAAWIHGHDGNPINELAAEIGAATFKTDSESLIVYDSSGNLIDDNILESAEEEFKEFINSVQEEADDLDEDQSLLAACHKYDSGFIEKELNRYHLSSYVELDYGGMANLLSVWYFNSDEVYPGDDVIIPNGYDQIIDELAKDIDLRLNTVAEMVDYHESGAIVKTSEGDFETDYVIVTAPLGVLKSNTLNFDPPLPKKKQQAIQQVTMGNLTKVALIFEEAFWPDDHYFGYCSKQPGKYNIFMATDAFSQTNALITFGFGNHAHDIEKQSIEQTTAEVMKVLMKIFGDGIPIPQATIVTDWQSNQFTKGSYSLTNVGSTRKHFEEMAEPVQDSIFFAGEHTHAEYRSTVHGAYLSGLRAAEEILENNDD